MTQPPDGWAQATVGEVLKVEYGKGLSKSVRVGEGTVPVVGSAGVAGHHDEALVNEIAIVIGRKGNAGAVWLLERPSWPIDTTYFARVPPGLDPKFLAFQLDGLQLGRLDSSTAIPSLRRQDLEAVVLNVPSSSEQRRVVAAIEEHLSSVDAAMASLAAAQARVAVFRAAAIQQAFVSHDWPWTTLGDIAELRGGVTKDSKRQDDPAFVEVPYLRVANVQRGYLDLAEVTTIRVAPAKAKMLELLPGDVLFNEGGDRDKLGRGWVWEGQVPQCIHQNHVFRARLFGDEFDPRFVSTHGNTWGQRWFETHGKQTTNLASINLGTLKRFPVPAPPIAEQKELMDQLDLLGGKISVVAVAVAVAQRRAAALRSAVLKAAFSGGLVQQDPADEPASALLDRIRETRPTSPRGTKVRS